MESGAPRLLHPIPEAVYLTGIGRSKFYELLESGAIESVKVGSRRLVPHDALVRFAESLRDSSAALSHMRPDMDEATPASAATVTTDDGTSPRHAERYPHTVG